MAPIHIYEDQQPLTPVDEHLVWKREFDELGPEKVRRALIRARWQADKRSAARQWLDRSDALNWKSVRPARGSFMFNLHSAKWWGLAAGAIIAVMAIGRLMRTF